MMWIVLSIVSVALLSIYWRFRNAVWGTMLAGLVIGLIVSVISYFVSGSFIFSFLWKGVVVGTLTGFCFELLGKLSDKLKKKE
jgi:Na+/proline symporter